jgi:L,D-transpeptidase YcbB
MSSMDGSDMSLNKSSGAAPAVALAALLAASCLASPQQAAAQQAAAQQEWNPFRDQTSSVTQRTDDYDRDFVRQWEAQPPKGFPTLAAANIAATKTAIARYTEIVKQGGWPLVPDIQMQAGSNGAEVGVLRTRLTISGDLREETGFKAHFDSYLEKAVKRFQASNGLSPTGIADKRTVAALNITAQARLKQLQANLPRLAELQRSAPKKYVFVNIPAAQIEAIENGQIVSRHAGVVGKIDRPSPIIKSSIHELNFNPVWHLPPTVIEKDLTPKGRDMQRAGQSVLVKYGIDAYDGAGRKLDPNAVNWSSPATRGYSFKQQPGKENPLGFVKINFDNQHSVYMHDTPSESVFGRNFRAASSGCVRVSGIEQLATWILADNGDWTPQRVQDMRKSGARQDVKVRRPVPLFWAYITAWATEDGVVQFRRDIYQKDGIGQVASAY